MSIETPDRKKALDSALHQIEKSFGKGAIMRLGDGVVQAIEVIPTGSIGLDYALGVGGIPRGRVVEIYGPESSGKTTLALHFIAEAQKTGGIAAFIDAEHALDANYAKALGVKVDDLLILLGGFGPLRTFVVEPSQPAVSAPVVGIAGDGLLEGLLGNVEMLQIRLDVG